MPCKRGAKKYCSRKCCLKNTSVQKMYGNYWKGKTIPKEIRDKISMSSKGRPSNSGCFKKGTQINVGRIRTDMQGDKNPKWKPKKETQCSYCKKTLILQPSELRDRNFCNRECWALGTRGINSPVYKGEISSARLRNRIAQLPEYREWHAAVMKRDGYKCVICSCAHSKERPLEVDHIKRFLFIVRENGIITPEDARNCKELWNMENGRTVCRICHRTTDTYGTKGTKKLQI